MASTTADSRSNKQAATTLRVVAAAVVCTALFAAVLMCVVGSPLRRPMSMPVALLLGASCGGACLAVRTIVAYFCRERGVVEEAILLAPTFVLVLLAVALPSSSTAIVTYSAFLVAELIWWFAIRPNASSLPVRAAGSASGPTTGQDPAQPAQLSGDETLRMTRSRGSNGEAVLVEFRERIEAFQRQATLHAAFSPPLLDTPDVHVEQTGGPTAMIKVSQAEAFGVRLDIRLDHAPETSVDVLLQCTALVSESEVN